MLGWMIVRFRADLGLPDVVVPEKYDGRSWADVRDQFCAALAAKGVTGHPIARWRVGSSRQYPTAADMDRLFQAVPVEETRWHKCCAIYGYS